MHHKHQLGSEMKSQDDPDGGEDAELAELEQE